MSYPLDTLATRPVSDILKPYCFHLLTLSKQPARLSGLVEESEKQFDIPYSEPKYTIYINVTYTYHRMTPLRFCTNDSSARPREIVARGVKSAFPANTSSNG